MQEDLGGPRREGSRSRRSAVAVAPEEQVLAIVREFSTAIGTAARTTILATAELRPLETALARLALNSTALERVRTSAELRRLIGSVVGSLQLQSGDPYGLPELARAFTEKPRVFEVLLSSRHIASYLGALLVAPTLYESFQEGRDGLRLTAVASGLRKNLSMEAFDCWHELAARSLMAGYRDASQSPTPTAYSTACQIKLHSLELVGDHDVQSATALFRQLMQIRDPIPVVLWELLRPEARAQISNRLPLDEIVVWMKARLEYAEQRAGAINRACDFLDVTAMSSDDMSDERVSERVKETHLKQDFEMVLSEMCDICAFVTLYLDKRWTSPRTGSIDEDQRVKDRETIEVSVGTSIHRAMISIFDCMRRADVRFECPRSFALELAEFLEQVGVYLDELCDPDQHEMPSHDDLLAGDTCEQMLIEAFDRAVDERDFGSAFSLRMFFPPDDRRVPTTRKFHIDDHIEQSSDFIEMVKRECIAIHSLLLHAANRGQVSIPGELQTRIQAIDDVMRHLPLGIAMKSMDTTLLTGLAHLVRGLCALDSPRQDGFSDADAMTARVSKPFEGCRRAADILKLCRDDNLQKHVMQAAFLGDARQYLGAVSDLIVFANTRLVDTLHAVALELRTPDDIVEAVATAFQARTLYHSAGPLRDQLPSVCLTEISAMLGLGYRIQEYQEAFIAPQDGVALLDTAYFTFLSDWKAGLLGMQHSPRRKQLLLDFLNFVRREKGGVPLQAKSLVFDSLNEFTADFLSVAQRGISYADYRDSLAVILGGFLVTSQAFEPETRIATARSLEGLFRLPHASTLCGSAERAAELARGFEQVASVTSPAALPQAFRDFLGNVAIHRFLLELGLIASE